MIYIYIYYMYNYSLQCDVFFFKSPPTYPRLLSLRWAWRIGVATSAMGGRSGNIPKITEDGFNLELEPSTSGNAMKSLLQILAALACVKSFDS